MSSDTGQLAHHFENLEQQTSAAQLGIAGPPGFAGFGTVGYPSTSGPYTFTITNHGGVATGPLAVSLGSAAQSISLSRNACS